MTDDRLWHRERTLRSSLPHVLVDSTGVVRGKPFKSQGAAQRALNAMRKKPSPFLIGDPKTWTIQPVEAE